MAERTPLNTYREIVAGLRHLGYYDALLQEDYKFGDWFAQNNQDRQVAAAAFAQTPIAYDSACIGVVYSDGTREQALVNQYRALGAPVILEIDRDEVREWAVSRKENGHYLEQRHAVDQLGHMFASRAQDWKPEPFLRAKNISAFHWTKQLSLFAGLLPELEERIQAKLEPLLLETLTITKAVYLGTKGYEPNPAQLIKLIFWLLTAKVFHDRHVPGFRSLGPDADEMLNAVANHYREGLPRLLNREARQAAATRIWSVLDSRNLSVEVLSQMWSTMLVDDETKKRLGIHRTSRTIVRYMIERIPFEQSGDDRRIILEPCSGSAVFLIGIMNALRHQLFLMTPSERHRYFAKHLAAIEKDPLGIELSRLALTLADFPNPGWDIVPKDVFELGVLKPYLERSSIVLCNPPFGYFDVAERKRYQVTFSQKPVELLHRVLNDLHPAGVLGFVLPRNIIDGRGSYAAVRKLLIQRFANIELTVLPDRAFEWADSEVALLIATDPTPHRVSRVANLKVNDNEQAWQDFAVRHEISATHKVERSIEEKAPTFAIPELPEVWDFLANYPRLTEVATLHRGIEWKWPLTKPGGIETGWRAKLVHPEPDEEGFEWGVPPRTKFRMFEVPHMRGLSLRPKDERSNSFDRPWAEPKVILNKSARSRGRWRIAAFPDTQGVTFYQTYIGVWPKSDRYDEWLLSAILNSPVANAFIATREGKTDITMETLNLIPVPHFTKEQQQNLRSLIEHYQRVESFPMLAPNYDPVRMLMEIDALVLDGYRMPPKLECQLLHYFRGQSRPVPHEFRAYLPADCDVYFSLSDFLSPKLKRATVGELRKRTGSG